MAGMDGLFRIPELRKRIIFTLVMLAVYRIGIHIPTPGVDGAALQQLFVNMKGTIFGWFNLFSGGALERFSILALGVVPYISSSIIFQLLTVVWPYFHDLQKEGDQGRKRITQYTRYGTVLICLVQGFGIATTLEHYSQPPVVLFPGLAFRLMTTVTLTTGTIFLMWVGEQISERGICNGISLLIYAGIAARIPQSLSSTWSLYRSGELSAVKILLVGLTILLTFYCIIFVERGARRIPIQYAKRIVGRKIYGGQNSNLPLKVNTAGVIPPIFASSLIMFPATLGNFIPNKTFQHWVSMFRAEGLLYNVLFVGLIIFFCYFYTAVTFKTDDVSDSLKKYGGFIPGIRPGPPTSQYIDYVLSRITLGGAIYIAAICVLPTVVTQGLKIPFFFGGTSVLILVGVALDSKAQIETFLLGRDYEGFMKHARPRGRSAYS